MSNKHSAPDALPTLDLSQLAKASGGEGEAGGGEGASMADMGMQVVDGGQDQVNLLRPIRHIRAMDI
jgi:hypothetical protein